MFQNLMTSWFHKAQSTCHVLSIAKNKLSAKRYFKKIQTLKNNGRCKAVPSLQNYLYIWILYLSSIHNVGFTTQPSWKTSPPPPLQQLIKSSHVRLMLDVAISACSFKAKLLSTGYARRLCTGTEASWGASSNQLSRWSSPNQIGTCKI